MSFLVEPGRPEDAAAAAVLLRSSIRKLCRADHGCDPARLASWLANKRPATVRRWIEDPNAVFLVARDGDALLGVASMTKGGMVTLNYVAPDARFRGVSKALVAALEDAARRLGLKELRLETTLTAHRFYRATGFSESDPDEPLRSGSGMVKAIAEATR